MKIGIYNPYLDSLSGGERYMLTIASCLQNKHEVDVFWHDESILQKAEERLSIDLKRVHVVASVFTTGIPVFSAYQRTKSYDVIVVLSDGSIPASFAKHNILHFQRPFPDVSGKSLYNQLKLKKYDVVVCNSQYTKKYIDQEYNVRSVVWYPPIAIDQFKPSQKEHIILSVGRFHPLKKQNVIIDAFAQFVTKQPDWKLILAGGLLKKDTAYIQSLQDQAKDLPIEFNTNIPFAKIKNLYERASIFWHAAGYGVDETVRPEDAEHFGIAPVEAMAAGCIPLVYDGGGLKEIVTEGKNGFLWKDTHELVHKTEDLLSDVHITDEIRENAINRSKDFSVTVFAKHVIDTISKLNET